MRFPLFQEQIAACHEFDGVRKEKERLTAAYSVGPQRYSHYGSALNRKTQQILRQLILY